MHTSPLCIFGEVLFDHFPDGRQVLGGAPFNVAWHLQAFGADPRFVSAVGADAEGARVRAAMADWGMDTGALQTAPAHPTGRVEVSLERGEPSYDIVADCAYDHVRAASEPTPCGLLYHGTLALRHADARAALEAVRSAGVDQVFVDVNLRDPWWSREQTLALIGAADWAKLNHDELLMLDDADSDADTPLASRARAFLERHRLSGLLVTLGGDGALGLGVDTAPVHVAPQPAQEVIDTVGAGDAFAAVTILGLLQDWPLQATLERAQAFASRIVAQRGATAAEPDLYQPFIERWALTT
ncbi:PfkB family carbohydrate kinase [Marichromatium gracile]|uniref:PfkB family carbohydrate kinase n=1 Tax=Marichromatium gracile TaxID=1048 RepID=UPI001F48FA92|nr:PfkB family carbohydrate kinase [Marichromatium gracile]MCF1182165.1 PfkB family carbohydrate kinase [Marichromatium gracile]